MDNPIWAVDSDIDIDGETFTLHNPDCLDSKEMALELSRLLLLVNYLPGMSYCCSPGQKRVLTFVSAGCSALTGYSPEELLGKTSEDYSQWLPEEDRIKLETAIATAVQKGHPYSVEYRLTTKTGEEKWVWEQGRGIYNQQQQLILLEGFAIDISDRKASEFAAKESQRQLQSLINSIPGIFFRTGSSPTFALIYISEGCERLTGYTSQEILFHPGENFNQLTHPEDLPKVVENLETASQTLTDYTLEYRIITKQGQEKWVWEKGHGVFDENGHFLGIEGFITDISHLKQMEAALRRSEANYRGIFEHCRHGIFQTTLDGSYLSANTALAHLYGYASPQEMITTLTDINYQLYVDPNRRQEFIQLLHKEDAVTNFQSQVYRKDGRIIWILENARAVRDEQENLLYYEGIVEDITQHKQINEQLQFRAFYDALTGLPNRAYLMVKLKEKLEAVQEDFKPFAIFFLDLDRFKLVNDSLGHLVGDQLLKAISGRLRCCLRSQDIIGRLGGDEFIVILDTLSSEKEAIEIAKRITRTFEKPFQLNPHQVYTGVSIGIVYLDQTLKSELKAEDLLRDADIALYQAKERNKGHFCLFDPTMHKTAVALFKQETELQTAFKEKQFCLYYQPIFTLMNQQVVGFEALVRWHHPLNGLVSPGHFIETCEDTGLIVPLGWWILEEACQQLVIWQSHYSIYQPPLSISVTLSVTQLLSSNLFEKIDYILLKTGLSGEFLKLEIMETCYLSNNDQVLDILSEIKNRNIQICIDDFGKGYSSLSYLHQFPIDILKIDKALVDYIDQDTPKCKVAKMILRLGQELGFEVVAEGIETASQFEVLLTQGCRFGQGYYFSKPLSANLVDEFLALHPPVIC